MNASTATARLVALVLALQAPVALALTCLDHGHAAVDAQAGPAAPMVSMEGHCDDMPAMTRAEPASPDCCGADCPCPAAASHAVVAADQLTGPARLSATLEPGQVLATVRRDERILHPPIS